MPLHGTEGMFSTPSCHVWHLHRPTRCGAVLGSVTDGLRLCCCPPHQHQPSPSLGWLCDGPAVALFILEGTPVPAPPSSTTHWYVLEEFFSAEPSVVAHLRLSCWCMLVLSVQRVALRKPIMCHGATISFRMYAQSHRHHAFSQAPRHAQHARRPQLGLARHVVVQTVQTSDALQQILGAHLAGCTGCTGRYRDKV